MSFTEWFDAFMKVQWPVVLMLVFLISLISLGLFTLMYLQLKFVQKKVLEKMSDMSADARAQRSDIETAVSQQSGSSLTEENAV